MPIVTCPKCPTKLRVADGATGNVRCPKCGAVFPAAAAAPSAAFEVVDDAPASPPPPARPPARPAASPPPPPPAAKRDFEFDDDPKPRKKRRDDDDDDDDRPRKRRRDEDDEDDDDRPRSRRRRRDDDDDEDDDRPRRKKSRRRDYDDDDEDWHSAPARKGRAGFGNAKTGVLLLHISFWLYMVSLALITLLILIAWVSLDSGGGGGRRGGSSGDGEWLLTVIKLPGFLGLANWIVALVGLGFCIGGPAKARGMAITATSLAGVHLVLLMITWNNISDATGGIPLAGDSLSWPIVASALLGMDSLLPALVAPGGSREIGTNFMVFFLAGVCELLRLIFTMLMVKGLAQAAKDYDSADKAQFGAVGAGVLGGATAALALLLAILFRMEAVKGPNLVFGVILLIYLAFTAMTVLPLISTGGAQQSLGRKAR